MDRPKSTTSTIFIPLLNGQRTRTYVFFALFCWLCAWTVLSLFRRQYSFQSIGFDPNSSAQKRHAGLQDDLLANNSSLTQPFESAPGVSNPDNQRPSSVPEPPSVVPLATLDDRTATIVQILDQHYWDCCRTPITPESILNRGMISQIESSDEFTGVLVGSEMWNSLSLQELDDPFRFYPNLTVSESFPFTILSYGKRLQQGQTLLAKIGAERVDFVSYPSLEKAFEDRLYLSRHVFRDAARMSWDNFTAEFSGKNHGYLLSTLNQWIVFEKLANGSYPDEIFIVEDDMFMVPDFSRKFRSLRSQLATVSWDVVFLGTCFGIRSYTPATPNLYVSERSRCFNAVLLKASVAAKILEAGACVDGFGAVDHLFNHYIANLNLKAYYVYPPLAYEQSKISITYPCQ